MSILPDPISNLNPAANPARKAQLRRFMRAVIRGALTNPQCRATVLDAERHIQRGHKVLNAATLFEVLLEAAPLALRPALQTGSLTLFDKSWRCLHEVLLESRPRNAAYAALEWQFALAAAAALTGATPGGALADVGDHAANGANGADANPNALNSTSAL
jgi:hypothetical protein